MNQKAIYDKQDNVNATLAKKVKKHSDTIAVLQERINDLSYFGLVGNDNAMTYIERLGLEAVKVESQVREAILDKNLVKGGNDLVPIEGYGEFRINNMKFLNHRWVQAEFSDGNKWGEVLIEYFYGEKNVLELSTVGTVLYPN
jgi:hypothetical protein